MRTDENGTGRRNGKKIVALFAIIFLLALSVPMQYLVRRNVVVGLPSGGAHSHAHGEEETEAHEHEHEHTQEEGHLASDVPLGINLIPNYGFEVGTRETIWGWQMLENEQGVVSYRDDKVSYRGLASAAVQTNEVPTRGAGWIAALDELPLDHDVNLGGQIKTELSQGEAYLAVAYEVALEDETREINLLFSEGLSGQSDWTFRDTRLYVPPEAVRVYMYLTVYGQGRAWFDDVSLVVEEPE